MNTKTTYKVTLTTYFISGRVERKTFKDEDKDRVQKRKNMIKNFFTSQGAVEVFVTSPVEEVVVTTQPIVVEEVDHLVAITSNKKIPIKYRK